ncbi:MAG: SH3 domain-containing protein [Gemmatimonadaceae bacterium]
MEFDRPLDVVAALYRLLSGPRAVERDWRAVRALFLPEAQLHSELVLPDGAIKSRSWTVDEFVSEAAEAYASEDGFWEGEVTRRMEEYGDIAHVWSTYVAHVGSPDGPPAMRGINSIQLLRRNERWWIASVLFQIERAPMTPIPARYLCS